MKANVQKITLEDNKISTSIKKFLMFIIKMK